MSYWPIKQDHAESANPGEGASVTLAGVSGQRLQSINCIVGYDDVPQAGALLLLKSGESTVICKVPVTGKGIAPVDVRGFIADPGDELIAELSAGGGSVNAYVNLVAQVI